MNLAVVAASTPRGLSSASATGYLELSQKSPVILDTFRRTYYNYSPYRDYSIKSFSEAVYDYFERNETTRFIGNTFVRPFGSTN